MKTSISWGCLICIICLILSGCQATPDEEIVINKDEGVLEEKINEEYEGENIFDVPEHIEEEIYTKDGLYTILINADTKVPEQSAYSIYSIVPDDFSQEEIDDILNFFFQDSPLYAKEYIKTKDMIQERIVQIKAEMKTMEENSDDMEAAQEAINQLEEQYDEAPETAERTLITSELTYDQELECDILWADTGYNELSSISVTNKQGSQRLFIYVDQERAFLRNVLLTDTNAEGQQMTIDEAEKEAVIVLNELKIENMVPIQSEIGVTEDQSKQGYIVTFRQSINGVPVASYDLLDYSQTTDMASKWHSDEIRVMLDDDGVSALIWSYKGKIIEELTPNVKMLPFDKIYDISKQQLKNKFAWIETSGLNYFQTIYVDGIVLEYVSAKEKNNEGSYLLIPAWNFYGDIDYTYGNGITQPQHGIKSTNTCILSLNAVDGTVIGS